MSQEKLQMILIPFRWNKWVYALVLELPVTTTGGMLDDDIKVH